MLPWRETHRVEHHTKPRVLTQADVSVWKETSHSHPKIYQGGATPEMATADLHLTDSTAFTSLALVFRLHRLQLKLYPIGLQAPKP